MPEQLLVSNLFGCALGAFTEVTKDGKIGLFELACSGAILQDEISDITLPLQAKPLRERNEEINAFARFLYSREHGSVA